MVTGVLLAVAAVGLLGAAQVAVDWDLEPSVGWAVVRGLVALGLAGGSVALAVWVNA